jgi:hypothetical protein
MSLISAIYTMMNIIANQVMIYAGICGTWKAIMTAIFGTVSESRDDHFETVFFSAPRIRYILERHIVGLGKNDTILTHTISGLVTTNAFLQKKVVWLA